MALMQKHVFCLVENKSRVHRCFLASVLFEYYLKFDGMVCFTSLFSLNFFKVKNAVAFYDQLRE